MKENYYMINMQKLLHLAVALHQKGFLSLEVIPSLAPSGVYWRCDFINVKTREKLSVSNWLQGEFDIDADELQFDDIAEKFENQHQQFNLSCRGSESAYSLWFSEMLKQLEEGELPYAFSDYYNDPDYWQTNTGKKIKTLN